VKLAIFPGDQSTFSITVGPPVGDQALKRLADPAQFERFVAAFAAMAPWRANGASEPIFGPSTPVLVMGQLRNRLRHFVDRDGPLAPGFVAVGDSLYHSNPIYGRGCPSALMTVELLDEALGLHPDDPIALARHYHDACETYVRPFWDAAVASDRRMLGDTRGLPSSNRAALIHMAEQAVGWFVDRGIVPATRVDPVVFRGLLRIFHMLDAPEDLVRNPGARPADAAGPARVLRGDAPPSLFQPTPREQVLGRARRLLRGVGRGVRAAAHHELVEQRELRLVLVDVELGVPLHRDDERRACPTRPPRRRRPRPTPPRGGRRRAGRPPDDAPTAPSPTCRRRRARGDSSDRSAPGCGIACTSGVRWTTCVP
jgi:hypothetical protein